MVNLWDDLTMSEMCVTDCEGVIFVFQAVRGVSSGQRGLGHAGVHQALGLAHSRAWP